MKNMDEKEQHGRKAVLVLLSVNLLATCLLGLYVAGILRGPGSHGAFGYQDYEKYTLYIGLNDKDTYEQVIDTEEAVDMVNEICARHVDGYTMRTAKGGWVDEKGILTEENTLVYCFYGTTEDSVAQMMDEVIRALNQNSILVTHGQEDGAYYYGSGEMKHD